MIDDHGNITPTNSIEEFGKIFSDIPKRTMARDVIGNQLVSSVFLAMDHGFSRSGPPVLFETMIFGGPHDGWQQRSTSKEGILDYHRIAVEMCSGIGFWRMLWWNIGRTMSRGYEKCRTKTYRMWSSIRTLCGLFCRNGFLVRAKRRSSMSLLRQENNPGQDTE